MNDEPARCLFTAPSSEHRVIVGRRSRNRVPRRRAIGCGIYGPMVWCAPQSYRERSEIASRRCLPGRAFDAVPIRPNRNGDGHSGSGVIRDDGRCADRPLPWATARVIRERSASASWLLPSQSLTAFTPRDTGFVSAHRPIVRATVGSVCWTT